MRQPIKNFVKDVDERCDAFYAVLDGQDDLGVVVRAHIFIEEELRHFVRVKAPAPEFVDFENLEYSDTLTLALILGLPKDLKPALRALGTLRNRFSHRPSMTIDMSSAKDLYVKLGREWDWQARVGLKRVAPLHPDRETVIERMTPKDLLCIACGCLYWSVLGAAISAVHSEVIGQREE